MVSRLKIQVPSPKAAKFRVQQHCAGVAHFLLSFHPDHHALPLWLTRFIEQLSCQVPGQRTWKQCVSHCAINNFHMKHSGTGSRTRREACPNGAEQTWVRWFRMCPHKIDSAPGKAHKCYPMLPASFCISGVCWIETSYVTAALANIGMQ